MRSIAIMLFLGALTSVYASSRATVRSNFNPIEDTLTIPGFFQNILVKYERAFYHMDSLAYQEFCSKNHVDLHDAKNRTHYYSILILHELFTSETAADCSKGNILNIPYLWHWVEPNPRYEIYFTAFSKKLRDTKPPKEFSKYRSYADIDRTPYIFLSDLAAQESKYYSASCDTFSTFGWCSEREMAFVALTTLLGFESKVVTEGNHSRSEVLVNMKMTSGEYTYFKVLVDNTFDNVEWTTISHQEMPQWRAYSGNTSRSEWYNKNAKSKMELTKIESHQMTKQSMSRIESAIALFISRN